MEVGKVAQRIGLSPSCGTNCTLYCSLARLRVEQVRFRALQRMLSGAKREKFSFQKCVFAQKDMIDLNRDWCGIFTICSLLCL